MYSFSVFLKEHPSLISVEIHVAYAIFATVTRPMQQYLEYPLFYGIPCERGL